MPASWVAPHTTVCLDIHSLHVASDSTVVLLSRDPQKMTHATFKNHSRDILHIENHPNRIILVHLTSNVIRPAKTGHVGIRYIPSHNRSCLYFGVHYLHSVP